MFLKISKKDLKRKKVMNMVLLVLIFRLDLLRESLEKDRQTLVASLSHELKTPVAAIKQYSSALARDIYDSKDKRKACAILIEFITASVSSLQNIEIKNREFYLGDWLKQLLHKMDGDIYAEPFRQGMRFVLVLRY
ncbi:His Kinase A (phospho-acceptor) domain protein [compost metagenome]